jgi:HK97 family phage prohead protease
VTVVLDTSRTVDVETDGRVLHGTLIPYDRPSLVADRDGDGNVRVYAEKWDDRSTVLPDGPIPLLTSHDETRPVGRIAAGGLWHERDGLHIEAALSGSSSEIEGIRARAADGVMAGLSVGFLSGKRDDIWTAPSTAGGVPTVLRRNAILREASLVIWPALSGAGVHRVTARTRVEDEVADRLARARDEQHARSQAFLTAHQRAASITAPDRAEPAVAEAPVIERRGPRPPIVPATIRDDVTGQWYQPAPELPPDPTELERQLHERAVRYWASDIIRLTFR